MQVLLAHLKAKQARVQERKQTLPPRGG